MQGLYILKSQKNGRYYIGSTNNFQRRLDEHQNGKSKYTRNNLPVKLVFVQHFESLRSARKAERWLKDQKDVSLIEKIIKEGRLKKEFS